MKNEQQSKSDGIPVAFRTDEEEKERERKQKRLRLLIITGILGAILITIVFILIGAYSKDTGWREISAGSEGGSVSASFSFRYHMDKRKGGNDVRDLSALYKSLTERAYQVFDEAGPHSGISGLYALNHANGETVAIEPELYEIFECFERNGSRLHYLGPVYDHYDLLFSSSDETLAKQYDPYYSSEASAYLSELTSYLNDPEHIDLRLLGENAVQLKISPEFATFCEDHGISSWIAFGWLKNGFILDWLARSIRAAGYTDGYIVSSEGHVACLQEGEEDFVYNLDDRRGNVCYAAGRLVYEPPMNIAVLRDYTMEESTFHEFYYAYADATFATAYIDPADGKYKASVPDLVVCSRETGVGESLLLASKAFLAEELDESILDKLAKRGVSSVVTIDRKIRYRGDGIAVEPIDETYQAVFIKE